MSADVAILLSLMFRYSYLKNLYLAKVEYFGLQPLSILSEDVASSSDLYKVHDNTENVRESSSPHVVRFVGLCIWNISCRHRIFSFFFPVYYQIRAYIYDSCKHLHLWTQEVIDWWERFGKISKIILILIRTWKSSTSYKNKYAFIFVKYVLIY